MAAAVEAAAVVMLEDQIQEFREAFCLIDKNGDGFITVEELAMLIQTVDGHPKKPREVRDMISDVDFLGNEAISFNDFLNVMARKMEENAGDELKEAFKVFDRDQDGFISPVELREVMMDMGERLTEDEALHMIREADFDGDGRVNYDEFAKMMSSF
ncbi:Calmodulin-like protein 8 [Linum grandiflorum]